jgi:hypothetical protein
LYCVLCWFWLRLSGRGISSVCSGINERLHTSYSFSFYINNNVFSLWHQAINVEYPFFDYYYYSVVKKIDQSIWSDLITVGHVWRMVSLIKHSPRNLQFNETPTSIVCQYSTIENIITTSQLWNKGMFLCLNHSTRMRKNTRLVL